MKIEKLQPGMTVYDVHKTKMGNTTCYTVGVWPVYVKSVDAEKRMVVASWNSNREMTYGEGTWSKWRAEKPLLTPTGRMGHRLATREEIKAHKAAKEAQ